MLFSSLEFLFAFFPVTLVIYFLLPQCARNYWLLIVSLFFYAWGEPKFLVAMLFSIVFNFFIALHIEEVRFQTKQQKLLLGIAVIINLSILFVFKYMNFVTMSLHKCFPATQELFEQTTFILPIGISFFTFQALSYVIDVYRGIPAQHNICYLGLYISMFPQLIAGPIVRYTTVADQIERRSINAELFSNGVFRFVLGFNKKVLLANQLAQVADKAFDSTELSIAMAWLGAIAYTMQIFFDFSAYSDMAIGLGKMFGFRFLENFNYPYISKTITEFWRRWHISLGTWFRDYVYFPMGGSRVSSKSHLILNLAVVWLATGIWHGANWTFILWGVVHGFVVAVEKLTGLPRKLPYHKCLATAWYILTMLTVVFGWVLFRAPDFTTAKAYLQTMVGGGNAVWFDVSFWFNAREYSVIFIAAFIGAVPALKWAREKISNCGEFAAKMCIICSCLIQMFLFVVSVSYLVMDAHNPFIYFNF